MPNGMRRDPTLRENLKGEGVPESKLPPEGQRDFTPEEHEKYLDEFKPAAGTGGGGGGGGGGGK